MQILERYESTLQTYTVSAPCLVAERWTKTYSHEIYSSKSTPPHPNLDSSTFEVFTLIVQVNVKLKHKIYMNKIAREELEHAGRLL